MPHKEYQSVVNKLAEARAEVEQYKAQLSTALNKCLDTVLRENSLIVELNKKDAENARLKAALEAIVFNGSTIDAAAIARTALEAQKGGEK